MKIGKCIVVLLMAVLLTTVIACGSNNATPTPTPTEITTPTPTSAPMLPNLIITDLTFSPSTGCAGMPVQVTATIQNQGTLLSQPCHWSWQLYPGSVASLDTIPSLPPGGTILVHTTATLTADITGTFNTTTTIDPLSEVTELNESDNQYAKQYTVTLCDYQAGYNSDRSNIQTALSAYMASHNGSIPLTNNSVTLNDPAGTYRILDICALLGAGALLEEVPASCSDSSFNNCDAKTCSCKQNAHYVWLANGAGSVLSSCRGGDCTTNYADGYQGIWP